MKIKPILFSRHMVQAILDGTKTQTRRNANNRIAKMDGPNGPWFTRDRKRASVWSSGLWASGCPHGLIGDRLWVKETFYYDISPWAYGGSLRIKPKDFDRESLYYRADGECCTQIPECQCGSNGPTRWRSSLLMPRWASRINLEIKNVRIERLQDISESDAEAEGVDFMRHIPDADETLTARELYKILWESINGSGSWDANPWVWAISFKRV